MLRQVVKAVTPQKFRWAAAAFLWKQLGANAQVADGVSIPILGQSDWYAFNELFVRGEYDDPIRQGLASASNPGEPFRVIDVGANIGFFALRVASLAVLSGRDLANVALWSIEGSPANYAKLSSNTAGWRRAWPGFTAVHGLVGARSGSAVIYEQAQHLTTSVLRTSEGRGVNVPFIDLDTVVPNDGKPFDMIKCDIEGAELEFLKNYPAFIARAKMFVGEFHHDLCDADACKALLNAAGLQQAAVLSREETQMGKTTTEMFIRPA